MPKIKTPNVKRWEKKIIELRKTPAIKDKQKYRKILDLLMQKQTLQAGCFLCLSSYFQIGFQ